MTRTAPRTKPELGKAGHHKDADAARALFEKTRVELGQLQAVIVGIETRLYRLRREQRH
jgi:hypothetical protein